MKSIGHGITCTADLENEDEVYRVMLELSQDIGHKLRVNELKACGVQISIRSNDLYGKQYQAQFEMPTRSPKVIADTARSLFSQRYTWATPVRAVTVEEIFSLINDSYLEFRDLSSAKKPIDKSLALGKLWTSGVMDFL